MGQNEGICYNGENGENGFTNRWKNPFHFTVLTVKN